MSDQPSINDLIIGLRDLVKDFDKIIDQAKLVKGKALSGDLSPITHLVKRISILIKKYRQIRRELSLINISEIDELSGKYIQTYRLYLESVSIPYTRDLVYEINEIIALRKDKVGELVRNLLLEMDRIP